MKDFGSWQQRNFRFRLEQLRPFDIATATVNFDRSFVTDGSKIGLGRVFNPRFTAELNVGQTGAEFVGNYYEQLVAYSFARKVSFGQLACFGSVCWSLGLFASSTGFTAC